METVTDSLLREEDSTTPTRNLEVSISFGRFENDLLSWEKWSSFSQNKYLEEVEKCATPGSVAAKKAYFEARNKLISVRKAEVLSKKMEACQEMMEENDFQNTCASGVNQYDEEVIEENVFGSELSSPGVNEHTEVETNIFMSQEPDTKDTIEATSTKQLATGGPIYRSEMSYLGMNEQHEVEMNIPKSQEPDEKDVIEAVSTIQLLTGETIIGTETSCPLSVDFRKNDLLMPESKMSNKDNTDGISHESNSNFDVYDSRNSNGRVQEEQISKLELSQCETDHPINMQSFVLRTAQTDEKEPVEHPFENNTPEYTEAEAILKIVESPYMVDQNKVDDAGLIKSLSPTHDEYVAEDIPAFKTEILNDESLCVGELPDISATKNAQTLKINPRLQNSSTRIFPANKSADKVKKILVSSVPGSPQMLTRKTSNTSVPTVKSASRSLPASKVKRTPASAPAVRKSEQFPNASRSTLHSPASSLKSSSLSLSKKEPDLLSSRKKIISPVVSQKPIPKSLHMSLNFGSKVSSSILGSAPVSEPRKSLFLEKMGDKDIVKRAFRAFQYMSNPPNIDINATSKKVVSDKIHKTNVTTSTPHPQKEKDRLIRKSEIDVKSKKSAFIYTSGKLTHSNEDKRKEVKKIAEKTGAGHLSNYKESKVTCTAYQRQSLTSKAAAQPGLHKRQGLSKSFQDKDTPKS